MVYMICEIDSSLKNKIHERNDQKFVYAKLNKTAYGTLLGAILFYEKLAIQLHEYVYVINPYDTCTFNKMVSGKQITVQFFIDNLHISCENMSVIDGLIKNLNNKFETYFQELAVTKGKIHNYIDININYSNKDYVKFTIYNFWKMYLMTLVQI